MRSIHFPPKVFLLFLITSSLISCSGEEHPEGKRIKRVFLPADETHEGWFFAAGDQVIIEGTVNGDAYIAGRVVEVNGTVNGDLLVAGGQVTVSGVVSDDIRAAGAALRFNGKVGKNISAAGGTVAIGKSGAIGGSVLSACAAFQTAGTISREARIAAGDMMVTGTVKGDVHFGGKNLSILPGGKVAGNLRAYVKEKDRVEFGEGNVLGKVEILTREERPYAYILGYRPFQFWFRIFWACSLLLTGLVLVFAFPRQLTGIGTTISQLPGKSFLWGIAGLILIPVVSVLLMATVAGIPLGLFFLSTFFWIAYLSQLSLGVLLGHYLFDIEGKTRWNLFWAFAVGVVIIQALTFVPYVRIIVILAGLFFGSGAILLQLKAAIYDVKLQLSRKT